MTENVRRTRRGTFSKRASLSPLFSLLLFAFFFLVHRHPPPPTTRTSKPCNMCSFLDESRHTYKAWLGLQQVPLGDSGRGRLFFPRGKKTTKNTLSLIKHGLSKRPRWVDHSLPDERQQMIAVLNDEHIYMLAPPPPPVLAHRVYFEKKDRSWLLLLRITERVSFRACSRTTPPPPQTPLVHTYLPKLQ